MKMGLQMKHEGTLHIVWMNRASGESEAQYAAGFADYLSSGGPMKMRNLRGDPDLIRFLRDEVHVHQHTLDSVLPGLRDAGSVSIFNVILDDGELLRLGLADAVQPRAIGTL